MSMNLYCHCQWQLLGLPKAWEAPLSAGSQGWAELGIPTLIPEALLLAVPQLPE